VGRERAKSREDLMFLNRKKIERIIMKWVWVVLGLIVLLIGIILLSLFR